MAKYAPLTEHLQTRTDSHWPTSFRELERVIGSSLPPSARRYPAWWSNNPFNNTMTRAWLDAGWKTENVDIANERVTFTRTAPAALAVRDRQAAAPTDDGPVLDRLDPNARATLNRLAEAAGEPVYAVAARLLTQSLAEAAVRLRADAARKAVAGRSGLAQIDVVDLVRKARGQH